MPWPAPVARCAASDASRRRRHADAAGRVLRRAPAARSTLPLDLHGTAFQVKAWRALATIPYGTTTTYGDQARRLGDARWARAVGAANGRNPVSIVLPCHRVVGSTGALTGFAGGLPAKRALLDHEVAVAAGRGPLAFPRLPS